MDTQVPSHVFCVESQGETVFVFTDVEAGAALASAATRFLSAPMICEHAAGTDAAAIAVRAIQTALRVPGVTTRIR